MILSDAFMGIADEAHAAFGQIDQAAEIIVDFKAFRIGVKCIDREITPRRILAPVIRECDGGTAAVGGDIAAQGGNLDRTLWQHCGDGAVLDPGRNRSDSCGCQPFDHCIGVQWSGDIDVLDWVAEQGIAHGSSDVAGLPRAEGGDQRGQILPPGPISLWQ